MSWDILSLTKVHCMIGAERGHLEYSIENNWCELALCEKKYVKLLTHMIIYKSFLYMFSPCWVFEEIDWQYLLYLEVFQLLACMTHDSIASRGQRSRFWYCDTALVVSGIVLALQAILFKDWIKILFVLRGLLTIKLFNIFLKKSVGHCTNNLGHPPSPNLYSP